MKLGVKLLGLMSWALMASGCANLSAGNLFSHYSNQNQEVYQAVVAGEYAKAKQLQSSEVGGEILGNFEKGRISFLAEDYPTSLNALESSDRAVRVQQDRATISVSDTATSVGS
ncbi:hypothetical protein P3701_24295, partial [Vibrio parahaemolyticus]|nr:hypothetical protein [Vibrio parahaemolyticus]